MKHMLDGPFAETPLPDDRSAFMIHQRRGDNFASARAVTVNQNDHRLRDQMLARLGAKALGHFGVAAFDTNDFA